MNDEPELIVSKKSQPIFSDGIDTFIRPSNAKVE
jgi:hypothetical protein